VHENILNLQAVGNRSIGFIIHWVFNFDLKYTAGVNGFTI